jgi:rhomboid family GlyGly-CTERM serine protease
MQINDNRAKLRLWRRWAIPLALGSAGLLVMILGDGVAETLRYQRVAILEGEFWRLLSGHLTHLGWSHLLLNLAGLALIWALVGEYLTFAAWLLLLLSCALFDGIGLLLFNPEVQWYVGLSGVLHGLFLAGSLAGVVSGKRDSLLLVVALIVKLSWEQLAGPLPGSEASAGGPVVVDAHLYGAVAGGITVALFLLVPGWHRRFFAQPPPPEGGIA